MNLEKHLDSDDLYFDARPRIRNIIKELEDEYGWCWPPKEAPDYDTIRKNRHRSWSILYTKQLYNACNIFSIIIGPSELLIGATYAFIPKTFIPGIRDSPEFSLLFFSLLLFHGAKHVISAIIGFGMGSMMPWKIGFVYLSWSFDTLLASLGIFLSCIGLYLGREGRIKEEMERQLNAYQESVGAKSTWDAYQKSMGCCGIHQDYYPAPPPPCPSTSTKGCLEVSTTTSLVIFIAALICMILALFLAIVGQQSCCVAENAGGDPIHKLLFQQSSGAEGRRQRKQELLSLLHHYCIVLGKELGLEECEKVLEMKEQEGPLQLEKVESRTSKEPKLPSLGEEKAERMSTFHISLDSQDLTDAYTSQSSGGSGEDSS